MEILWKQTYSAQGKKIYLFCLRRRKDNLCPEVYFLPHWRLLIKEKFKSNNSFWSDSVFLGNRTFFFFFQNISSCQRDKTVLMRWHIWFHWDIGKKKYLRVILKTVSLKLLGLYTNLQQHAALQRKYQLTSAKVKCVSYIVGKTSLLTLKSCIFEYVIMKKIFT